MCEIRCTCVWGCQSVTERKDHRIPKRRVATGGIDGSRNSQDQSDAAQQSAQPIRNPEGPNHEFKVHAPDKQTATPTAATARAQKCPMPDGNLTKKTCVNRNHPCCIRKRSSFFTAPSCRLMFYFFERCCRLMLPFLIRQPRLA
jgi:hypothetical protein